MRHNSETRFYNSADGRKRRRFLAVLFAAALLLSGYREAAAQTVPSDEINEEWMKTIRGGDEKVSDSGQDKKSAAESAGTLTNPADENGRDFFGPSEADEPPSFFSVLLRFVLLLGAMTLGLYYFARFIKKKQGIPAGTENNLIRVIVTQPLMNGKYLQIVDMAGQLLVIGVSENGVSLVKHIEDGPTADKVRLWKESQSDAPVPEFDFLGRIYTAVTGKQFQFWKNESGRRAGKGSDASFEDLIKNTGGVPHSREPDTAGLGELLARQKKHIASLKKRKSRDEDEI